MKVGLVTNLFPSPEHPYITDWVRELSRAGVELTILAERAALPAGQTQEAVQPQVVRLNDIHHPLGSLLASGKQQGLPNLPRWSGWMRELNQQKPTLLTVLRKGFEYAPLAKLSFDLVHFNAPQIAVRRFELGALFGCPTLVSFRGQDMSFHAERYDRLLAEADHLHFISHDLLGQARRRGFRGDHYSLIPPLVDVDFYHPPESQRRGGAPNVLFTAARFTWTKGWEFVLQAVALLVERGYDVHYYLAGEGEFKEAVLYTMAELGLQERVHLLGWLSPEAVREWLWNADLYLLASVEEGFNNSVLQAQACGLPVVCSDAGGLPENIVDGENGLLFHRRDAWDMAEKIEALLNDPERRKFLGLNGRQNAVEHYSLEKLVPLFVEMYQGVLR